MTSIKQLRILAIVSATTLSMTALLSPVAANASSAKPSTARDGGTLSADEQWIRYASGAVEVSVVPMAYADCPSGWLCLWEDDMYSGRMIKFQDVGYWQNLTDFGFNDEMSSWRNNRSKDAQWSYDIDGGGTKRCMQANSASSNVGSTDNDQASAVILRNSSTYC